MAKAYAQIFSPRNEETLSSWAEKNIFIPHRESSEHGGTQFSLKKAPYQKIIFDWLDQPGKHEMIINKSSRAGVSFAALVAIAHRVKERNRNVLYVLDEEDTAGRMNEKRFQPLLRESGLLEKMVLRPSDFTKKLLTFPRMLVHFLSAAADGTFDEKEVDEIYLDEMRNYRISNSLHQSRQRLKNKRNSKLLAFSEPTTEDSEQEREWRTSSMEEIHLACPHCGEMQELTKDNLIFKHCKKDNGKYDIEKLKEEVYYQCKSDEKCKIYEHHRLRFWDKYETVVTNKDGHYNKRGLRITDLHSLFVPYWDTAKSIIEAQGDSLKLEKLDTAAFARVPKMRHGEISEDDIDALCSDLYGQWECPFNKEDVGLVAQEIDTQKETFKTVINVFDKKKNHAVVAWGEFDSLDECKEWGQAPIRTMDGDTVHVFSGLVDEGDGNMTNLVREWCAENHAEGWMPIKGMKTDTFKGMWKESEGEVTGYVESITVLQIPERRYKYDLIYRDILGRQKNKTLGKPLLYFPSTIDEDFRDEMRNEFLRKKKSVRGAYAGMEWYKKGTNDYMDCVKYAKAHLAYMHDILIEEGLLDPPVVVEGDLSDGE